MRDRCRLDRSRRRALRGAAAVTAVIAALVTGCATTAPAHPAQAPTHTVPKAAPQAPPVRPLPVTSAQLARLPAATTDGSTPAAPTDPAPFAAETGTVLHPDATRVVYARPGGSPVAALPATQLGSPTWVPVVQSQPGWDRVLLPARPNRSTGWIYLGGGGLRIAYSPYQVQVNLAAHRLTVLDGGRRVGSWTVADGAAGTPTPTGRTFLLASLAPLDPTFSPLILPLGAHSDTLATYGGGPGTVALHGWPDPAVFGHSVSHGCVRVPPGALRLLSRVPLGSSVTITG